MIPTSCSLFLKSKFVEAKYLCSHFIILKQCICFARLHNWLYVSTLLCIILHSWLYVTILSCIPFNKILGWKFIYQLCWDLRNKITDQKSDFLILVLQNSFTFFKAKTDNTWISTRNVVSCRTLRRERDFAKPNWVYNFGGMNMYLWYLRCVKNIHNFSERTLYNTHLIIKLKYLSLTI